MQSSIGQLRIGRQTPWKPCFEYGIQVDLNFSPIFMFPIITGLTLFLVPTLQILTAKIRSTKLFEDELYFLCSHKVLQKYKSKVYGLPTPVVLTSNPKHG